MHTSVAQSHRRMTDTESYTPSDPYNTDTTPLSHSYLYICCLEPDMCIPAVVERCCQSASHLIPDAPTHHQSPPPPMTPYSSVAKCRQRKDEMSNYLMAQSMTVRLFASSFQGPVWNSSNVARCIIDLMQQKDGHQNVWLPNHLMHFLLSGAGDILSEDKTCKCLKVPDANMLKKCDVYEKRDSKDFSYLE